MSLVNDLVVRSIEDSQLSAMVHETQAEMLLAYLILLGAEYSKSIQDNSGVEYVIGEAAGRRRSTLMFKSPKNHVLTPGTSGWCVHLKHLTSFLHNWEVDHEG